MGPLKKLKRFEEETIESSDEEINPGSEMGFDSDQNSDYEQLNSDEENASGFEGNGEEEEEMWEDEEEGSENDKKSARMIDARVEELEKDMSSLRREQDTLSKLKHHKNVDATKGPAVKNQKALWEKNLEFLISVHRAFSKSNKLPQGAIKSAFCSSDEKVDQAYSDLVSSCKETISSMLDLQEALIEKNPSITQELSGNTEDSHHDENLSGDSEGKFDEDWSRIHNMNCRIAQFRNHSVDKWHEKTQVASGAAAAKGQHRTFNQKISAHIASSMRDPSRMIKMMQLRRTSVGVFGEIGEEPESRKEEMPEEPESIKEEDLNGGGDPELLDDSEFFKELVKEFLDHASSEMTDDMKQQLFRKLTRKRKHYDRHASKHRKIRYTVHDKIVNFMAPVPMKLPAMASKLFGNLFGITRKPETASAAEEIS